MARISAPATPRNFPSTKIGRATGLEMTVSAVKFSISRFRTLVAMKAARRVPQRNTVDRPRSTIIRWSSSIVKPARRLQKIRPIVPTTSITSKIGCRMLSKKVLRIIARVWPNMGRIEWVCASAEPTAQEPDWPAAPQRVEKPARKWRFFQTKLRTAAGRSYVLQPTEVRCQRSARGEPVDTCYAFRPGCGGLAGAGSGSTLIISLRGQTDRSKPT